MLNISQQFWLKNNTKVVGLFRRWKPLNEKINEIIQTNTSYLGETRTLIARWNRLSGSTKLNLAVASSSQKWAMPHANDTKRQRWSTSADENKWTTNSPENCLRLYSLIACNSNTDSRCSLWILFNKNFRNLFGINRWLHSIFPSLISKSIS